MKPHIECAKNGPLLVSEVDVLKNSEGKRLQTKKRITLCRCGGSHTKPYCDGTHGKISFNDRMEGKITGKKRLFEGREYNIQDIPSICSHAGYCDKERPEVFWTFESGIRIAHPDKGDKEKAIATIKKCPSGALSYKIEGKLVDSFDQTPAILIAKNGPYYVQGNIALHHEKSPVVKEHYALCRCGSSKIKPYCDGSHRNNGFVDNEN